MLFIVGRIAADYAAYLESRSILYGLFIPKGKILTGNPACVIELDFTTEASILRSLFALVQKPDVSGVMTTGYEHFVVIAAVISAYFGVPGLSLEAAHAATEKIIMRKNFMDYNPEITPDYAEVNCWDDIVRFIETHTFPVMLKPANLMKSLYITKNCSDKELQKNFEIMQRELPDKYKQLGLGEPHILIESFMPGSMHTVAGFINADGELHSVPYIVDCITARDIGRDDSYLFARSVPSKLSDSDRLTMQKVTKSGVAALGLTNTPIHAELILTSDGPKLIEIAARIGGFRPRMYEQAYGIDMYRQAIETAYGKPVDIRAETQQACTVLELFPEQIGRYAGIANLDTIHRLPSYLSHKLKIELNDTIGKASQGYRSPLIITLAGSANQIGEDMAIIKDTVTILVTNS